MAKFKIDIKARWSARIIFSAEIEADANATAGLKLGLAVRASCSSGADLSGADLRGADLSGADLSGAHLSGADLSGAHLRGANLSDADLRDAHLSGANLRDANLRGADLSDADLRDANLRDADLCDADLCDAHLSDADLRGADLSGAHLRGADLSEILEKVPLIPNIDAAILAAIDANKASGLNGLDMSSWHGDEDKANEAEWCQTTHCRAGYAICLAGKDGFELERKYGPANAGMLLYLKSTPDAPIPNWTASNAAAMADIRARAKKQLSKAESR